MSQLPGVILVAMLFGAKRNISKRHSTPSGVKKAATVADSGSDLPGVLNYNSPGTL